MFNIDFRLAVIFISSCCFSEASNGAYKLNLDLFKNYNPTSRPVKNASSAVKVKLDIALRSIEELNEKSQVLTTSIWLRIYWKDEFLTWDPKQYSGIRSFNANSKQIWVPDLILYNSIDAGGSGMLHEKLKTRVIVNYDGNITWLSPIILRSECAVDLVHFPFDSQTCPLVIGLWTYDELRVHLHLMRKHGDTSSYRKNGLFLMQGMPAFKQTSYFVCCPGVPYARIHYKIKIQRKTVFYLLNFFFPGILLVLVSFTSFMLPPECGERVSMGITNLLAVNFFLLMASNNVPPLSLSIPMITTFFTAILIESAVILISTAIAIKLQFFTNDGPDKKVPWLVDVFINKYLAKLLCMKCRSNEQSAKKGEYSLGEEAQVPGTSRSISNATGLTRRPSRHSLQYPSPTPEKIAIKARLKNPNVSAAFSHLNSETINRGMNAIVQKIREEKSTSEYRGKWRYAIKVIDRALGIVLAVTTGATLLYMFIRLPKILVK